MRAVVNSVYTLYIFFAELTDSKQFSNSLLIATRDDGCAPVCPCPAFAILDECTDAVSIDVEKKLYAAAAERGIICITVSKRLVLNEFHDQELRLGAHLGPNGRELVKVS